MNTGKIIGYLVSSVMTLYLLYQGGPLTTLAHHVKIADVTIYQLLDVGICSKLASRFGEMAEAGFAIVEMINNYNLKT